MGPKFNVLILGASYGSLLSTKLLLAGHAVTLVCTQSTADLINREGTVVRLPIRERKTHAEIFSRSIDAELTACAPECVDPSDFDLAVLAMQESQYGADGVRDLMARLGAAQVPCLAIMNMPPLPFLERIPGLATERLDRCYADPEVWDRLQPGLVTLASPDPQAVRPADEPKNVLHVGLATNFKVAPFEDKAHAAMLQHLQDGIESIRFHANGEAIELPVKLKAHDSLFVPLAKWPMLVTGNYRCVRDDKMISIREAVHTDVEASREVYDRVANICIRLGATEADLVPFEKYAKAAEGLAKPSSAARALAAGACHIERVDLLLQQIARQQGVAMRAVDEIVDLVDQYLSVNRANRPVPPKTVAASAEQLVNA